MRRIFGAALLVAVSFGGLGEVVGPALAVMETPTNSHKAARSPLGAPGSSISTPVAVKPAQSDVQTRPVEPSTRPATSIARLDIPIAWQLTRARVAASGATTLTESFRETWTLEQRPSGSLFLQSPRARVSAYRPTQTRQVGVFPGTVLISEHDLARLIGIKPLPTDATADSEEPAPSGAFVGTPVTLHLAKPVKGGSDVTLSWSEDEHYAVHIDVGATTVF